MTTSATSLHSWQRWLRVHVARWAIAGLAVTAASPALAADGFGQLEINQEQVITVASPVDNGASYQLLILEQVGNQRSCWEVEPGVAEIVQPLLLQFDFTGICSRATDSNGYSIRVDGQDLGWRYSLRLVPRGDDNYLALVGVPVDRSMPTLEIGQTRALVNDFAVIELNPAWRLTKRTYGDRTLGHFYLTSDFSLETLALATRSNPAAEIAPSLTPDNPALTDPSVPSTPSVDEAPAAPAATAPTPEVDITPTPAPAPIPLPDATPVETSADMDESDAIEVRTFPDVNLTPLPPQSVEPIAPTPNPERTVEFTAPNAPNAPNDIPELPPQAPSPL